MAQTDTINQVIVDFEDALRVVEKDQIGRIYISTRAVNNALSIFGTEFEIASRSFFEKIVFYARRFNRKRRPTRNHPQRRKHRH